MDTLPDPFHWLKQLLWAALLIGASFVAGYVLCLILAEKQTQIKDLKTENAVVTAVSDHNLKGSAINQKIDVKVAAKTATIKAVTGEVIRDAAKSITPEIDRKYPLSNGFVRLHDAAALSNVAGPPSVPDDSPSDVAESEAIPIIAANYGTCNEALARDAAWRAWAAAQGNLYKSGVKK